MSPQSAPVPDVTNTAVTASQRVVVMGVSGCGKTTVGQLIALKLGGDFIDGDAFHPEKNVSKMRSGTPLNDADRKPWLKKVSAELRLAAQQDRTLVVGCSALKRSYRDIIRGQDLEVRFIHLHGSRELLAQRLLDRSDHFMPHSLLDSQLHTLEMLDSDESGRMFHIGTSPEALTGEAHRWIRTLQD